MNIFKSICRLFSTKNNLIIQLSILALAGLGAVCFVNSVSLFWPNYFYNIFAPIKDDNIGAVFCITGLMIFIFFTGYKFKYASAILKNENADLPSISLDCFPIFLKILPVFIVWGFYYLSFYIGIAVLFGFPSLVELLVYLILLIIVPFINLILIIFSKDFKYDKVFFSPLFLIQVIKKTYIQVAILVLSTGLIVFAASLLMKYIFAYNPNMNLKYSEIKYALLTICFFSYLQEVINLGYFRSAAQIIRDRIFKQ